MSNQTTIWIVAGSDGKGNSGHAVLGLYPTEELAQARIESITENGDAHEYMWYDPVVVGPMGGDCYFTVD
jgi:hypothetical protein